MEGPVDREECVYMVRLLLLNKGGRGPLSQAAIPGPGALGTDEPQRSSPAFYAGQAGGASGAI